jgi:hypothetical protein
MLLQLLYRREESPGDASRYDGRHPVLRIFATGSGSPLNDYLVTQAFQFFFPFLKKMRVSFRAGRSAHADVEDGVE